VGLLVLVELLVPVGLLVLVELKCSLCVAVASYSLKVVALFYLKGIT